MTAIAQPVAVAPFEHGNSLRIFGPAGSGKTRELIRILQEHVADGDFYLVEGIIVSFTRAAAHDIAKRVNPKGEPGRYHCTIHALCKRYYGFEGEIADTKLRDFFRQHGIDYSGRASPDPDEWMMTPDEMRSAGSLIASFWSLCRNRRVSIREGMELWDLEPELGPWRDAGQMEQLYRDYLGWKHENGLIDFTDMLEYAVENPPHGSWPFFVLDEAQDCTPLQWAVAQGFASCADVAYIAGDDDQAIYQWAGATPYEFLRARVRESDVLHVNHRSDRKIVESAQEFIRQNVERQDKNTMATRDGGEIVSLGAGEIPIIDLSQSTFVMARAHYLNVPMMEELTAGGVPFVDRRNKYGVNGAASQAYKRFLRLQRNHALTLDEVRLLFELIPSTGERWLVRGAKTRLMKIERSQRVNMTVRLNDLGMYGATEDLVGAIRAGDIQVLGYMDQERLGYLREVEKRHGVEMLDESTAAAVCQVGSIHSFKGLECDHAILHAGMPKRAALEAHKNPEPERRTIYVAMTRPRYVLTHYNAGPRPATTWQKEL